MKTTGKHLKKVLLFTLALLFLSVGPAFASLTFDYSAIYSGGSPSGPPPWMTAEFTQAGLNTVNLTLTGRNSLAATEFISGFYFNSNTAVNTINFTTPWSGATASYSSNAYNADGAGGFDIQILFPTSNQGARFGNGSTAYLTLTGTGLLESAFNTTNAGPGIMGIYTGAHVQGIAGGLSGWSTVPIPPTVWLLGAGLLGLVGIRRGFLK